MMTLGQVMAAVDEAQTDNWTQAEAPSYACCVSRKTNTNLHNAFLAHHDFWELVQSSKGFL